MDLNTIKTLERPSSAEAISHWREGYAWLAGGTWLYSEPQPKLDTLIDLEGLNWPSLEVSSAGLEVAAGSRRSSGSKERRSGPRRRCFLSAATHC
jgi:CO/xanthine dehydrogenase FAD-binding subunit